MSTGKELRLDFERGTPKILSKDTKERVMNERETHCTVHTVLREKDKYIYSKWTDTHTQ